MPGTLGVEKAQMCYGAFEGTDSLPHRNTVSCALETECRRNTSDHVETLGPASEGSMQYDTDRNTHLTIVTDIREHNELTNQHRRFSMLSKNSRTRKHPSGGCTRRCTRNVVVPVYLRILFGSCQRPSANDSTCEKYDLNF